MEVVRIRGWRCMPEWAASKDAPACDLDLQHRREPRPTLALLCEAAGGFGHSFMSTPPNERVCPYRVQVGRAWVEAPKLWDDLDFRADC